MSSRRAFARLWAFLNKQRLDAELDDDIQAHLELAEKDAIARGLSPEEARWEARRRFGGIAQMTEEHRDRRSFRWIEMLLRDFRYGLASLWRTPGFTVVVVGVLALGIGGTVAMFSVVDSVLMKPLPFPNPGRIVSLWEAPRPGVVNTTTVPQFLAWKRAATEDFDALAAEQPISAALNDKTGPTRLSGELVTSEYFRVFATGAALGRTFTAEDQSGAAPVIILSHSAWETYFGADPEILHRRIILGGQSCEVIGVLEPGAFDRDKTQFWKLLVFTPDEMSSTIHRLTVYGRLRAGVTLSQATQQMQAIYAALRAAGSTAEDRDGSIVVELLSRLLVGANLHRSIMVAFGAVFLVLLIACANVANLLFARGAVRRMELAVRAALGAGRGRLIAQLSTECLALCVLGGAAGVAIAFLLIRLAKPLLSQSLPFTAEVALNLQALVFGAAVVLGVALLTGAFPALQASFGDLAGSLKQSARGPSGTHIKVRRTIVIGEVALSLVLLCGALLLVRSWLKLQHLDTGIRIENVITASINLSTQTYSTPQKAALFYEVLTQRLRSVPGVAQVGISTVLPLHWIGNGEGIFISGVAKPVLVRFKRVDAGYFHTLDIPVLTGRGINDRDREGSPRVIVINQALAARLADAAGIERPVGTTVRLTSTDYLGRQPQISEVQIVGVIRSERTASPGYPDPPVVYVPLAQAPNPSIELLVRSPEGMAAPILDIRQAVREVDPNLPLGEFATMQQIRDETLSGISRPAWLISAFASVAVLLSAIGLYGVISYSVTQRRTELGIRIALGARPGDVVACVLRNALAMVGAGLTFGLAGVYALTRILTSLLFEVSPLDPLALVIACVSMMAIGLVAGFVPAQRAARFDPVASLRDAG
ncbi:MAG TPA: ABC transporter permease [Bryobacteraceae bacterium]|nr:ABC transporter permease [Bryobacteraceae bacterium]